MPMITISLTQLFMVMVALIMLASIFFWRRGMLYERESWLQTVDDYEGEFAEKWIGDARYMARQVEIAGEETRWPPSFLREDPPQWPDSMIPGGGKVAREGMPERAPNVEACRIQALADKHGVDVTEGKLGIRPGYAASAATDYRGPTLSDEDMREASAAVGGRLLTP